MTSGNVQTALPSWQIQINEIVESVAKRDQELRAVLDAVNDIRKDCGVQSVIWNPSLTKCAQLHSDDQAENIQDCTHVGSNGSQLADRVDAVGYKYRSCAENVAYGHRSAEHVMKSWKKSPGHFSNMISPEYNEIGIAVAYDPRTNRLYWTQVFGTESPDFCNCRAR